MPTMKISEEIALVIPIRTGYSGITLDLGFLYLYSALRDHGLTAHILHCPKEDIQTLDQWRAFLSANPQLKILGFRSYSVDHNHVKKMAAAAKEILPGCVTIVGGPHPSCVPEYVLEDMAAMDYAFVGEGEIGFPVFCQKVLSGGDPRETPGLVHRDGGGYTSNPRQVVQNLDELPRVRWEDVDVKTYPSFLTSLPFIPLMATRGCPYQCTYCAAFNVVGRKMRFRSVENVIEELRFLKKTHQVTGVNFSDDELTLNRAYFKELCEKIIEADLGVEWECSNGVRLDTMDEEILDLMYRAGCRYIAVGVESGSDRILAKVKKKVTIEKIREKTALVKRSKVEPQGLFMLGFPGETVEEMNRTIQLAIDLDFSKTNFSIFMPLPGSEAFNDLVKEGLIDLRTLNWDEMKPDRIIYSRPGIPDEKLKAIQRKAYFRFYLRPGPFKRIFKEFVLKDGGLKALWSKIRSVFLGK